MTQALKRVRPIPSPESNRIEFRHTGRETDDLEEFAHLMLGQQLVRHAARGQIGLRHQLDQAS